MNVTASRLIDADKVIEHLELCLKESDNFTPIVDATLTAIKCYIEDAPTIDAVEVVRCKDCIYYHKSHVEKDGVEYDYSEMPKEAYGILGMVGGVTANYGINVGGQCEYDKNNGYSVDKSVFRNKEDFCSRGERKEE